MENRNLSIISGAGISVASGLKTFRGEGGLWEGYDVMKVASVQGWLQDRALVMDFYNQRRAQLKDVTPNKAHTLCADLEKHFKVQVITQNVDNLHERGGSSEVLHLHGELCKVRSTIDPDYIIEWNSDLFLGDLCPAGGQMRPHIVWFGEEVPLLQRAAEIVSVSDLIVIVGTSMQVYPAASIINFAKMDAKIFYIDPDPQINYELSNARNLEVISETAEKGMEYLYDKLLG